MKVHSIQFGKNYLSTYYSDILTIRVCFRNIDSNSDIPFVYYTIKMKVRKKPRNDLFIYVDDYPYFRHFISLARWDDKPNDARTGYGKCADYPTLSENTI
jgi:CRISPR/Cas system-associated protein Cas5 (RAMP superfamily)